MLGGDRKGLRGSPGGDAARVTRRAPEADVQVVGVASGVFDEGGAAACGVLDRLLELGLGDPEGAGAAAKQRVEPPGEEHVLYAAAGGEGLHELPGCAPVDLTCIGAAEVGAALGTAAAVAAAHDREPEIDVAPGLVGAVGSVAAAGGQTEIPDDDLAVVGAAIAEDREGLHELVGGARAGVSVGGAAEQVVRRGREAQGVLEATSVGATSAEGVGGELERGWLGEDLGRRGGGLWRWGASGGVRRDREGGYVRRDREGGGRGEFSGDGEGDGEADQGGEQAGAQGASGGCRRVQWGGGEWLEFEGDRGDADVLGCAGAAELERTEADRDTVTVVEFAGLAAALAVDVGAR